MKPNIPTPSAEQLLFYLKAWDEQENYVLQEKALDKLFFNTYPTNTDIDDILIKASALNDFYSTNILSIFSVAKHILSLDIDERLCSGDPILVNDLAEVNINGIHRRFYSFASKYCSRHKPLLFPIYDRYVEKVLLHFKNVDKFCSFGVDEIKDYPKFIKILTAFQEFYGLTEYNKKQLDVYLWQLGKKFFLKNYTGKKVYGLPKR